MSADRQCDCLNDCGDDPWLAKGKADHCDHFKQRAKAAALLGSYRWVPVTESLPDDEESVLIVFEDGDVWVGFLDAGTWRTVDAMPAAQRVTHWMLFPEGPKP